MATRIKIVGGPSKFDLMVSHYHGGGSDRHAITFMLKFEPAQPTPGIDPGVVKMVNDQIKKRVNAQGNYPSDPILIQDSRREDGSGENWLFEGICAGHLNAPVKGYYNTQRRTGYIEIVHE
jgi:hypothetical protein